jgi:hypothetical protein
MNKSLPKYTEIEFCQLMEIEPRSKSMQVKTIAGAFEKFRREL